MEKTRLRRVRRGSRSRRPAPHAAGDRTVHRARSGGGWQSRSNRMARPRMHRRWRKRSMTCARSVHVRGVVQGVGFRPFVVRLARANDLAGWVLNQEDGVDILLEGDEPAVHAFLTALEQPPPAARITAIQIRPSEPAGLEEFTIRHSRRTGRPSVRISPDLPICADCLDELFDPSNKRYRYPYIN